VDGGGRQALAVSLLAGQQLELAGSLGKPSNNRNQCLIGQTQIRQ